LDDNDGIILYFTIVISLLVTFYAICISLDKRYVLKLVNLIFVLRSI